MNNKLIIDKSKWESTTLGELATEISSRVDNPSSSIHDRFVGLEHFVSGDMKISKWGSTNNLVSSAKAFKNGDILFARRNAYLRRASMVDFDGCCSGDAFVLRENTGKIVSGFLSFVMNSDKLWDYANSNAAGTMSKRVKWRDLANYEFLLPPKEEQKKLAELLWAMDDVIEKEKRLLDNLNISLDSFIEKEIHGIEIQGKTIQEVLKEVSQTTKLAKLSSLGVFMKGKGIPKSEMKDSGFNAVRYGELYTKHHRIIRRFYTHIDEDSKNNSFRLQKNDVVFAGSGETITEIGKSAAFVDDVEAYVGGDTLIFRPTDMDGYYLGYLMNSKLVRNQLNKVGTGATVMHVYNSDLQNIKVPKTNKNQQKEIGQKCESFYANIFNTQENIQSSKSLQKSLINQIF